MAKMQIGISPERIFTSAQATASWLKDRFAAGSRVLAVGEVGLWTPLRAAGFTLVDDHREAELVVAGLDRHATYAKLAEATLAINAVVRSSAPIPTSRSPPSAASSRVPARSWPFFRPPPASLPLSSASRSPISFIRRLRVLA